MRLALALQAQVLVPLVQVLPVLQALVPLVRLVPLVLVACLARSALLRVLLVVPFRLFFHSLRSCLTAA